MFILDENLRITVVSVIGFGSIQLDKFLKWIKRDTVCNMYR